MKTHIFAAENSFRNLFGITYLNRAKTVLENPPVVSAGFLGVLIIIANLIPNAKTKNY